MRRELLKYSKFLSLVLRHDPSAIGVEMDEAGWVELSTLLPALQARRSGFSEDVLFEIVETNEKRRFALSEDGLRIRASQGHSIGVDLGLEPMTPPARLFHGTADRHLPSIREQGLRRGQRDHVHLSTDEETAERVGARHGRAVVLEIDAKSMAEAGFEFRKSANGVWLASAVPAEFIRFPA